MEVGKEEERQAGVWCSWVEVSVGQQEGRTGQAMQTEAGRSFPQCQNLNFFLFLLLQPFLQVLLSPGVLPVLCLQSPHPSFQQGGVLAPAHFVVPL